MKLNYRDKIIAAFLIAIAICAITFFAVIRPKYKKIKANEKTLSEVQEKKKKIDDQIAEIPGLKKAIIKIKEDTNEIAQNFVPVDAVSDPLAVDEYMQKFADECHVKLRSVESGKTKLAAVSYYYADNSDKINDLRKAADANGSLEEEYNSYLAEQKALSQRAKESIIQAQYGVNIEGTRANVWKYLEALKSFDKNLLVNSVNISDYSFGKDACEKANVPYPESDEEASVPIGDDKELKNTSNVKIVVTLYSVFEMPEPNVDSVPAASK